MLEVNKITQVFEVNKTKDLKPQKKSKLRYFKLLINPLTFIWIFACLNHNIELSADVWYVFPLLLTEFATLVISLVYIVYNAKEIIEFR